MLLGARSLKGQDGAVVGSTGAGTAGILSLPACMSAHNFKNEDTIQHLRSALIVYAHKLHLRYQTIIYTKVHVTMRRDPVST